MSADPGTRELHQRIGQLTRELHDALRALGYDRSISAAAQALPDARDRLAHIAALTGQAAERVLTAVEAAQAEQEQLADGAAALITRWDASMHGGTRAPGDHALPAHTREYLERVGQRTDATRERLHTIMMAQDFHDLTGQVITRVADVAHRVEASLVELLVETRPAAPAPPTEFLGGPNVRPGADAVASQGEVDDLLASLGF